MADLDLAKLLEQFEQVIRENIRVDASGLSPAVASHYLTGFDTAAQAIFSLLRPALQAAWEAGRDASADHIEGTWWDAIEAGRIAEHIRALTPPDYLTGGDDAR